MTQSGTWVSYSGSARLMLAIILLAAAGGLVYAGIRFRRPVRLPRPGATLTVFAPLVLVELTTLSLLTATPVVKLSRAVFFCLALMLLVFAVWALAGFGYPSAPVPFAMNVVSKILAFVTALSLFFPEWFAWWRRGRRDVGGQEASGGSGRALGGRAMAG